MKCHSCGNDFIHQIGSLELPSKILGNFSINDVHYYKCNQCEEILLSDKAWLVADQEENRLTNEFLSNLPLKDFIGASKVALILGISRQAVHKHKRIRRGFIYSIKYEGKTLYNIKSVNSFKDTGDGRFPLKKQKTKQQVKYIVITMPYSSEKNNFLGYGGRDETIGWTPTPNTTYI